MQPPIVEATLTPAAFCCRRHRLQKLFAAFPAGGPGVGLLLLRIVIAVATVARWVDVFTSYDFHLLKVWIPAMLAIVASIALLIGFLTPIAGASMTLVYLVIGSEHLFAADIEDIAVSQRPSTLRRLPLRLCCSAPAHFLSMPVSLAAVSLSFAKAGDECRMPRHTSTPRKGGSTYPRHHH